jgi:hypothetical protein
VLIFHLHKHLFFLPFVKKGDHLLFTNKLQGVSKKRGIWKSGMFCFIDQLSNDFQQINLITCKNLIHCGYFEYNAFSDNQVLPEIWLDQDMASQTFWLFVCLESCISAVFGCLFVLLAIAQPLFVFLLKMTFIGDNTTFTVIVHMNQSMRMDYFFYPLSYDMKFKLNIQDLIHVNASHHSRSRYLTSHMLVEKLILRKCFILKIAAMNQMFTGYKIYLLEIIGKLINKTKRATFPYPPFFWDAL